MPTKILPQDIGGSVDFTISEISLSNGTNLLPSLAFSNDQTTGLMLNAAGSMALVTSTAKVMNIDTAGLHFQGSNTIANTLGTAALPSYTFESDNNTGIYGNGSDRVSISTGGTARLHIDNSGFMNVIGLDMYLGATKRLYLDGGGDTYIYEPSANQLDFVTGGSQRFAIAASGLVTTLGKHEFSDGSAGAPALSFSNDPDTGIYRSNPNQITLVANASTIFSAYATRIESHTEHRFQDGTVSLPGINFVNDTNTGIFRGGVDFLSVSCGGTEVASFAGTGVGSAFLPGVDNTYDLGSAAIGWKKLYMMDGTAALPSYTFRNDTNTGIYRASADQLIITTGGVNRLTIENGQVSVETGSKFLVPTGTALVPTYSFGSDQDTGFYNSSANSIGITLGGAIQWDINSNGTIRGQSSTTNLLQPGFGSAATPGFGFTGDENTGIYRSSSDSIAFSTGGTFRAVIGNISAAETYINANTAGTPWLFTNPQNGGATLEVSNIDTGALATVGITLRGGGGGASFNYTSPTAAGVTAANVSVADMIQITNAAAGVAGIEINTGTTSTANGIVFGVGAQVSSSNRVLTLTENKQALFMFGTAAVPSGGFFGDEDTGIYRSASNQFAVSVGGEVGFLVDRTAVNLYASNAGTPLLRWQSTQSGLESSNSARIYNSDGTAALPSYTFGADSDTGMYRNAANSVVLSAGGSDVMVFNNTPQLLSAGNGTVGNPAYSFGSGSNTGMYRTTGRLNFAVTNTQVMELPPASVITRQTTSLTAGDGTNSFSAGTMEMHTVSIAPGFTLIHLSGQFTTGGTVTGASLRIGGIGTIAGAYNIVTSGTIVGYAHGLVTTNSGSDPRALLSPSIVSGSIIGFSRANGAAWSASTVYNFHATVVAQSA